MISEADARAFAVSNFPDAPEKLTEHLGVELRRSPLNGCDGWCLTNGTKTLIRINSNHAPTRQRFTLAHELGHLILGVPAVVGESFEDIVRSNSSEERRVNDLAAELLLPAEIVKASLPNPPVIAEELSKLARKAQVSDQMAAVRVCNLAQEIGLVNASVVQFDNDQIRWQWSKPNSRISDDHALYLLHEARETAPHAVRHLQDDGDVIVASIIENAAYSTATLFVQLLPSDAGLQLSTHEQRLRLESHLFKENPSFRSEVNGCFGYFKGAKTATAVIAAVAEFWERYGGRFKGSVLETKEGKKYVELRIAEWF